ncbi:unnamed protein product [Miscanthus lutarioriparius]|uniref:DUF4220 domain-containing protein n=1 Tax=Miscanthus lutarioriparius TaxID=422564 RepID=A0A811NCK2_9POAL|nr:unnamed protein product [Miscanthus lutarioriparius]
MQQLQQQERSQHGEPLVGEVAPPLLVMGEDRRQVVNHPHRYVFTNGSGDNNGLVTLDKIWQSDNVLLTIPKLKDLCLSYALFKLMRCRFARYKISDVDSVRMLAFSRSLLLMEGGHDRVFRVIADELCFVHDYYYPSSSISYAMKAQHQRGQLTQIECHFWCTQLLAASKRRHKNFGSLYVDLVVVFLLLALVLSTERWGASNHNRTASLHRIHVGDRFIRACNGKGTADIILTWHIATCILEVRHPYRHDMVEDSSLVAHQHKIVATHLSRYCAYLMTWFPEILPDEVEWSKTLYDAVHQDATRVISVRAATSLQLAPEAEYLELVQLLSEGSRHEVLQNGVRLGKQLVEELNEAEETAWAMLADFWVEMILYGVAPSNNLRGHSKAIARGGEVITLLWALLFHVGIVSRPGETGRAAIAASV